MVQPILLFFELIKKKEKEKKLVGHPQKCGHPMGASGVGAPTVEANLGWLKCDRGYRTTLNLFYGWLTTLMGGQATHYIFLFLF